MPRSRPLTPPNRLIRALYALGLGVLVGRLVLLLMTTGRKTGLRRVTPLQYEEINEAIYVASARGTKSDWFRNIQANPRVKVRMKSQRFEGIAEPVTDPARIADFIELRLRRHPKMMGTILQADGMSSAPNRAELEEYAAKLAIAIIRPAPGQPTG